MKIALLTPQWLKTTGGPSRYVASLQDTLEERGHSVDVVTSDEGAGALHIASRPLQRELMLFGLLMRRRPDIVHIHGRVHFIPSAIAYRLRNASARIVFSFHTQPYIQKFLDSAPDGTPDYTGARRRIAASLLGRCDAITTVSASIVENLNRFYSLGIKNAVTIPSAGREAKVSVERVRVLKEELGLLDAWPIVSSIGVLSWDWKVAGHLASLRAFGLLRSRYPNARLLLAGDGAYRSVLDEEVQRLGLQDSVRLLGNIANAAEVLAASDLYLHMAPHEGCSLAIIEAMFAGRPIVASNEGGTPGLLRHGESALLTDRSPENIAREAGRLLDDPSLARGLAQRARDDARNLYSWSFVTAQYDALYQKLRSRPE